MKYYILVGAAAIIGATVVIGYIAATETSRMESFTRSYASRRVEEGAATFENNCARCHGPQGGGTPLAPALNRADLFDGTYLAEIGWAGTLEDFVTGTVAAGRAVPSANTSYPERMPTWSEVYGGPLRIDQVENVVSFILNWEERALAAGQPTAVPGEMMGVEIDVELPPGDAARGEELVGGPLGCAACHILAEVGPPWAATGDLPGIGNRGDIRIAEEDYTGFAETAEGYLVESVVQPNAFVNEGFTEGIMPSDFGSRITLQDMADILAYLLTFE